MSGFMRSFYCPIESKFGSNDERGLDILVKEKKSRKNADQNAYCITTAKMNNALFRESARMKYGDQKKNDNVSARENQKPCVISQYIEPNILISPTVTEILSEGEADVHNEVAELMTQQRENANLSSHYYFDTLSDELVELEKETLETIPSILLEGRQNEQFSKEEIPLDDLDPNLQSKASEYIGFRDGMEAYTESKIQKPTLVLKKPLKELYNNFSNCSKYSTTKGLFFNFKKQYFALQAPEITGRAFEHVSMPSQCDNFFD